VLLWCLFCGHHLQLFGVNIICVMDAPRGGGSIRANLHTRLAHDAKRAGRHPRASEKARGKLQSGRFFTQQPPICGGRAWGGKINALGVRCPRRFVCRRKNATRSHRMLLLSLSLYLLLRHKESREREKPCNKFDARGWLFSPFFDVNVSRL
jgi:hypothetical protein